MDICLKTLSSLPLKILYRRAGCKDFVLEVGYPYRCHSSNIGTLRSCGCIIGVWDKFQYKEVKFFLILLPQIIKRVQIIQFPGYLEVDTVLPVRFAVLLPAPYPK